MTYPAQTSSEFWQNSFRRFPSRNPAAAGKDKAKLNAIDKTDRHICPSHNADWPKWPIFVIDPANSNSAALELANT
jgi:hypothetical protein